MKMIMKRLRKREEKKGFNGEGLATAFKHVKIELNVLHYNFT